MNPEFQRNLWIELTPKRLALMAAILGLLFFAVSSAGLPLAETARRVMLLILVLWGTRNAAMSVVGEIRDRTWDFQRLSSLSPAAMAFGKLFGSTIYNWFGAALCLPVVLVGFTISQGLGAALVALIFCLCLAIVAQAASLLASLIAIRRRQSHTRLDVFIYQAVGLIAAALVTYLWTAPDLPKFVLDIPVIQWWGIAFAPRAFYLASLALLAGWTLVGCYRAMRTELQIQNSPLVWVGFLLFIGVYFAGLDSLVVDRSSPPGILRLLMVTLIFGFFTYVMILLEPKDGVHLRWLGAQLRTGKLTELFGGLYAWIVSYLATIAAACVPLGYLLVIGNMSRFAFFFAALGFLTRDVGLFLLLRTRGQRPMSDWPGIMVLIALYALMPFVLHGIGADDGLFVFYPYVFGKAPYTLVALAPWIEAALVLAFAFRRLALPETQPARK